MSSKVTKRFLFALLLCTSFHPPTEAVSRKICGSLFSAICLTTASCTSQQTVDREKALIVTAEDQQSLHSRLETEVGPLDAPLEITFVPWTHAHPFAEPTLQNIDEVARVNFEIYHLIANLNVDVIFQEGSGGLEDFTQEEFKTLMDYFKITSNSDPLRQQAIDLNLTRLMGPVRILGAFPKGIPDEYSGLNDDQKYVLYKYGAGSAAFAFNHVKEIRGTEGDGSQITRNIIDLIPDKNVGYSLSSSPEIYHQIFEVREIEALVRIADLTKKGQVKGKIVLLFGAAHQFQDYSDAKNFIIRRLPTAADD